MARDQRTEGRTRLLTIADGTPITPGLVRILDTIAAVVDEALEGRLDFEPSSSIQTRRLAGTYDRTKLTPVLIQRADGIAVFVASDREVL